MSTTVNAAPLLTTPLAQAWPAPTRPRPIVVIGAGGIVRDAHLPAYKRLGFAVAGMYDPRRQAAEALAQRFDVPKVFDSMAQATEARLDVVYDVAVPAAAVAEVLGQLPSGAAVLVQKPLGETLEQARAILRVAEERRLTAAMNFQLRFSPAVLALKDALARDLLGTVYDAEVRVNVRTPWHLWDFLKGIPRLEVLYHSVHYLDVLRSLLGEPRSVHCRVTRNPELAGYADVASATILDYGKELRCTVSTNHLHGFGNLHAMSQLKVEGTKGAVVIKLGVNLDYPRGEPDSLQVAVDKTGEWLNIPLRGSWFTEAFEGPMSNLQRFVCGEDPSLVSSLRDAFRTMALVEACYESSTLPGTPIPS